MPYAVTPKFTADFFHVVRLLVNQAQATAAALDHHLPEMRHAGLCFGSDSDALQRLAEQVDAMAPDMQDAIADAMTDPADLDAPHFLPEDFAV